MEEKRRIFIAEGQTLFRDGLRAILNAEADLRVVGEAQDGLEAIRSVERLKPDLVLLNLALSRMNGTSVIRRLRDLSPRPKILVLTEQDGGDGIRETLQLGVGGYCLKQASGTELLLAIRTVMSGRLYLSPSIVEAVLRNCLACEGSTEYTDIGILSVREREVLKLIGEGFSAKEISEYLGISTRTVERHRFNMMRKLDVHKTSALVGLAYRNGLIGEHAGSRTL
ncbi:MAG: response regulator transcription factor [Thermodesulfobacteriota bacterium]